MRNHITITENYFILINAITSLVVINTEMGGVQLMLQTVQTHSIKTCIYQYLCLTTVERNVTNWLKRCGDFLLKTKKPVMFRKQKC